MLAIIIIIIIIIFPTQWFSTGNGPLVVIVEALFALIRACVSEHSCCSCFADFASFYTNFGKHNRLRPKMLNTE